MRALVATWVLLFVGCETDEPDAADARAMDAAADARDAMRDAGRDRDAEDARPDGNAADAVDDTSVDADAADDASMDAADDASIDAADDADGESDASLDAMPPADADADAPDAEDGDVGEDCPPGRRCVCGGGTCLQAGAASIVDGPCIAWMRDPPPANWGPMMETPDGFWTIGEGVLWRLADGDWAPVPMPSNVYELVMYQGRLVAGGGADAARVLQQYGPTGFTDLLDGYPGTAINTMFGTADRLFVGDSTGVHVLEAGAWSTLPPLAVDGVIWGDLPNVYHVNASVVRRFNGTSWAPVPSPGIDTYRGIAGVSSSEVYVFTRDVLYRADGPALVSVPLPPQDCPTLDVIAADGSDLLLLAQCVPTTGGVADKVWRRSAGTWSALPPLPVGLDFFTLSSNGTGSAFVTAYGGSMFVNRPGADTWTSFELRPAPISIRGVAGRSASDLYAYGPGAGVFTLVDGEWTMVPGSESMVVSTAFQSDDGTLFVADVSVSGSTTFRRYDGGSWITDTTVARQFSALRGTSASDVYTAGGRDLWHFDGTTWGPASLPLLSTTCVSTTGRPKSAVYRYGTEGLIVFCEGDHSYELVDGAWQRFPYSLYDVFFDQLGPTTSPAVLYVSSSMRRLRTSLGWVPLDPLYDHVGGVTGRMLYARPTEQAIYRTDGYGTTERIDTWMMNRWAGGTPHWSDGNWGVWAWESTDLPTTRRILACHFDP